MDRQSKRRLKRIVEEWLPVRIGFHSDALPSIMPVTVKCSGMAYIAKKTQMIGEIDVSTTVIFTLNDIYCIDLDGNVFTIWLIA